MHNHPNPFNASTRISYCLPEPALVSLRIYNIRGQEIAEVENGFRRQGAHSVAWDGLDNGGRKVTSGIYLVHLIAGDFTDTVKMILTQ